MLTKMHDYDYLNVPPCIIIVIYIYIYTSKKLNLDTSFLAYKIKLIILWPTKLYKHLENSFSYSLIPSLLLNN